MAKSSIAGITDYQNQNNNGVPQNPNPYSETTANSQNVYKLNGAESTSGAQTGLGITLKVMGGDRIDIFGKSYYNLAEVHRTIRSSNFWLEDLKNVVDYQ